MLPPVLRSTPASPPPTPRADSAPRGQNGDTFSRSLAEVAGSPQPDAGEARGNGAADRSSPSPGAKKPAAPADESSGAAHGVARDKGSASRKDADRPASPSSDRAGETASPASAGGDAGEPGRPDGVGQEVPAGVAQAQVESPEPDASDTRDTDKDQDLTTPGQPAADGAPSPALMLPAAMPAAAPPAGGEGGPPAGDGAGAAPAAAISSGGQAAPAGIKAAGLPGTGAGSAPAAPTGATASGPGEAGADSSGPAGQAPSPESVLQAVLHPGGKPAAPSAAKALFRHASDTPGAAGPPPTPDMQPQPAVASPMDATVTATPRPAGDRIPPAAPPAGDTRDAVATPGVQPAADRVPAGPAPDAMPAIVFSDASSALASAPTQGGVQASHASAQPGPPAGGAPSPTLPQTAPMPFSAVPIEIGMRALEGGQQFRIRLHPEDLGRVDVKLDIDSDGSVTAQLVVDRVETLAMLQRDAKTLERAFDQAGLRTAENGLQFSLDAGAGQDQRTFRGQPQPDAGPATPTSTRTEPPEGLVAAIRRAQAGQGGLDIRI